MRKQVLFLLALAFCGCLAYLLPHSRQISLPVVMYHSVVQDYGTDNPYVISSQLMEEDLAYLQDQGYTTLFMDDLIQFVYQGTALPEKPILLTFDDGYLDNYSDLFPLLEEYQMKAVVCLIGTELLEQPEPLLHSYLSYDMVQEMSASGLVDFQCHTYDFHSSNGREGSKPLEGESVSDYQALFSADLQQNTDLFLSLGLPAPSTFSYPQGAICDENEAIVQGRFQASLLTYPTTANLIRQNDPSSLHNLSRHNREPAQSPQEFFQIIETAQQYALLRHLLLSPLPVIFLVGIVVAIPWKKKKEKDEKKNS